MVWRFHFVKGEHSFQIVNTFMTFIHRWHCYEYNDFFLKYANFCFCLVCLLVKKKRISTVYFLYFQSNENDLFCWQLGLLPCDKKQLKNGSLPINVSKFQNCFFTFGGILSIILIYFPLFSSPVLYKADRIRCC